MKGENFDFEIFKSLKNEKRFLKIQKHYGENDLRKLFELWLNDSNANRPEKLYSSSKWLFDKCFIKYWAK